MELNKFSDKEINSVINLGFRIEAPPSEITINKLNTYFGGVYAIALENNQWNGAEDPGRNGVVRFTKNQS